MKRRLGVLAIVLVAAAGEARTDETTFCNAYVTSLPYTITTQGHYCFNRNLSTGMTGGSAITINSDFVVLDLNNFKLGGGAGGLGTLAVGIYANARRNITIRNGNIRGFKYGILLEGTESDSGGHLIENNHLDGKTFRALEITGDTVVIRNNVVTNTGGATDCIQTYAIFHHSDLGVVRDNVVSNTFASDCGGATGLCCFGVFDRNVVKMGDGLVFAGIYGGVCRDNTVLDAPPGTAFACALVGDNYSDP